MNKRVIVVIGLPASGKTTFCNNINLDNNRKENLEKYIIFDDFIYNFYNGDLVANIIAGKNVCINDPRLCLYDIFNKYISIIETYVDHNNIHLILFENNPTQCSKNINKNISHKKNLLNTIIKYSKKYSINNYAGWEHDVIKVYDPSILVDK
jgi:GTPase SAR1 family protein